MRLHHVFVEHQTYFQGWSYILTGFQWPAKERGLGWRSSWRAAVLPLLDHLPWDKICLYRGQSSQGPDLSESWQSPQISPSSAPNEEATKCFVFVFSSIWICLSVYTCMVEKPEKTTVAEQVLPAWRRDKKGLGGMVQCTKMADGKNKRETLRKKWCKSATVNQYTKVGK